MEKKYTAFCMNTVTVLGLAGTAAFIIYGMNRQIFTSRESLQMFLDGFGIFAPVIFTAIQIVQVVVPILPGAIGCLGGVLIFGPFWGFVYNYTGICIGSIIVFLLSKRYGKPIVMTVFKEKTYDKYIGWLEKGKKFDKAFAAAIFFPVAPDDLLCYLAGLTEMRLGKFVLIILLGKPLSIFLYSLGLTGIMQGISMLCAA
ncbi:TVP38/TMEM64 family protein [Ruminococcus gauvreauii]|uniref:TVP38/TMEM64 family membrane protein n=1 Tax=Ruminococcus gauvreauii TaxID=438033 RepID=A0ABY5VEC1_9FIRM|nr:TVP38/TMEM64 family protein [Ruminococcus gauvreauii]UWP58860.1 TVP38/TMEM64 family protein [Ruminococcus gauvreauii]